MVTSSSTAVTIESLEWDSFISAAPNMGICASVVVMVMMVKSIRVVDEK